MMFNFMISVYLSIRFRVGLSMFALLALNLYYFWKTHTNFIDEAERQYLDQKILKRSRPSPRTQELLPDLHIEERCPERRSRKNIGSSRLRNREAA
jgi:hypothetical protein